MCADLFQHHGHAILQLEVVPPSRHGATLPFHQCSPWNLIPDYVDYSLVSVGLISHFPS